MSEMTFSHNNGLFSARSAAVVDDPELGFSSSERREVMDLVGNREFEVALHNLAWITHEERKRPSADTLIRIADLMRGIVDPPGLPPTFSTLLGSPE